jgi:hypothetical protein
MATHPKLTPAQVLQRLLSRPEKRMHSNGSSWTVAKSHETATKEDAPRFAGSLERAIGKSLLPAKQRKARVRPRVRDSRRIEVTSALQDAILCFTKREC